MDTNGAIALLLAGVAAYVAWRTIRGARLEREMAGWPKATARILNHNVVVNETRDSEGRPDTDYEPHIAYEYEVAGKRYTGSRLGRSQQCFATERKATEYLARWPVGSETQVMVNPAKPGEAFLTAKGAGGGWWIVGFFLVLAFLTATGVLEKASEAGLIG